MRHKVLIGFMGSGKTTVSKLLAQRLGIGLLDTDEEIQRKQQRSITCIFAESGEKAFRQMERELLKALAKEKTPLVISTGGGLAVQPENKSLLKALGDVIYLQVRPETVLTRLAGDETRPLLQGEEKEQKVRALLRAREPFYEAAADEILAVDDLTPEQIVEEIIRRTEATA